MSQQYCRSPHNFLTAASLQTPDKISCQTNDAVRSRYADSDPILIFLYSCFGFPNSLKPASIGTLTHMSLIPENVHTASTATKRHSRNAGQFPWFSGPPLAFRFFDIPTAVFTIHERVHCSCLLRLILLHNCHELRNVHFLELVWCRLTCPNRSKCFRKNVLPRAPCSPQFDVLLPRSCRGSKMVLFWNQIDIVPCSFISGRDWAKNIFFMSVSIVHCMSLSYNIISNRETSISKEWSHVHRHHQLRSDDWKRKFCFV
jgi:hypothetical protein